ncbi:MAG: glycosyltransferase [Kiritimatiellae bacterium]|nr:glycosyltransferase [Kiritimatiellia bacterium]
MGGRPSKARILHVITRLDPGGSTTNTIVSVDRLREFGFDTALAYGVTADPGRTVRSRLEQLGLPVFYSPSLVRNPNPVKDVAALLALRRLIRGGAFDLVHTHSSKAGVLGRLAARQCGVPAVHTPHGHVFYGYFGRALSALFVRVERAMARSTARIVSLTDIETDESLARGVGRPEQYRTIHSGVPLDAFRAIPEERGAAFRARWNVPAGTFLFVSVGRLVPIKGHDVLLRAFARSDFRPRHAVLAVLGDGPLRRPLETLCSELACPDRVRFCGGGEDVRAALRAADAFALASRNEGMGRVFVEAMAAGVPPIGTAVGGVPAVLRHEQTGLLVPPDDPASLARALERIVAEEPLRLELGAAAARDVYPEYDEATMVRRLAGLYREVLT